MACRAITGWDSGSDKRNAPPTSAGNCATTSQGSSMPGTTSRLYQLRIRSHSISPNRLKRCQSAHCYRRLGHASRRVASRKLAVAKAVADGARQTEKKDTQKHHERETQSQRREAKHSAMQD